MTNFDSRRISLVEFYSNDQTSKSILEKSRGDIKKRKAVQGVTTRWSIKNRKNYNDGSHRSTRRGVNVLSPFDAYLRIYSHFRDVPN